MELEKPELKQTLVRFHIFSVWLKTAPPIDSTWTRASPSWISSCRRTRTRTEPATYFIREKGMCKYFLWTTTATFAGGWKTQSLFMLASWLLCPLLWFVNQGGVAESLESYLAVLFGFIRGVWGKSWFIRAALDLLYAGYHYVNIWKLSAFDRGSRSEYYSNKIRTGIWYRQTNVLCERFRVLLLYKSCLLLRFLQMYWFSYWTCSTLMHGWIFICTIYPGVVPFRPALRGSESILINWSCMFGNALLVS